MPLLNTRARINSRSIIMNKLRWTVQARWLSYRRLWFIWMITNGFCQPWCLSFEMLLEVWLRVFLWLDLILSDLLMDERETLVCRQARRSQIPHVVLWLKVTWAACCVVPCVPRYSSIVFNLSWKESTLTTKNTKILFQKHFFCVVRLLKCNK